MSEEYFVDESIFCMIKECNTPAGRMRFEEMGCGIYHVLQMIGDAWRMVEAVRVKKKNPSCKDLFNRYLNFPGVW